MLLAALHKAATKADVRQLLEEYGYEPVNEAWGQLDDLTRASLSLVKGFNGQVLHDVRPEPDTLREQQADSC